MIEVVEILETSPKANTIALQNENSIVFAWNDYRFTRLSNHFGSVMMLNNKFNQVNSTGHQIILWQLDFIRV